MNNTIQEGTAFVYPWIDCDIEIYLMRKGKEDCLTKEQKDKVRTVVHRFISKDIERNIDNYIELAMFCECVTSKTRG